MKAVVLQVIHDFILHCQRRSEADKKSFLISKREIDLHAMVLRFFGPEASLYAQGVAGIDLAVTTPRVDVEFKYLRKKPSQDQPVNDYDAVMKDWKWLCDLVNENGRVFKQSCWVVFIPSIDLFDFHLSFQVPAAKRPNGWANKLYAPFVDLVEPQGADKLKYKTTAWGTESGQRDVLLVTASGKLVRRQIVGNPKHPLWCLIYSRVGDQMAKELDGLVRINVNN